MQHGQMVQVRRPQASQQFQAPQMRLGRSQISLSHQHKTTFDAGELIPYLLQEVVPGDTFTCKLMAFARIFSALHAPIMDNIEMSIDFFFVPNRLVWDNWENFLGAHDDAGAQDVDFTIPILAAGVEINNGEIAQYMGLPEGIDSAVVDISALPFRGYRLIYNEWYRDQNLIDSHTVEKDNGPDFLVSALKVSAKKPDYFTTSLPYLQKGDAVSISLGEDLDVLTDVGLGVSPSIFSTSIGGYRLLDSDQSTVDISSSVSSQASVMYVALSGSTSVTINALREAAAIQRLLERDARGGTRHPEIIRAHFGVDVPDYRTQRPEYLGGGRGYINVSPVANTSDTATKVQGNLAGIGTGTLTASWAKSFVEHGYIFGILRARAEVSYQQGVDRHWSRSTKFDFLWPEFAHLGEQAVLNKELWIQGDATDELVFGYQERYADYRFKKSLISGKFAADAIGSLDFWHLAEDFASQPALNQVFVEDASPMARVTAIPTEPDFIIDGRFDLRVARALPVRPVPSLAPARF